MLTIAVCDDESSQRDLICQMLRSDLERRPSLAAKIRTFSSGQELLSAVKETGEFDLYLLDIIMPELSGRALRYELSGGECVESVTLRTSFQEAVVPLLADSRFFLCGSSFAVNLHYVSAVEKNHLLLDGGVRVPLSRGRTAAARRQWSAYWLGPPVEDPGV